jgi:RNA polymerase sigma-70 factor, ECF subfamily
MISPEQQLSTPNDEMALLAALRQGDETAFTVLVDRYHTGMVRLAQTFVASQATAEDVAQDAWLGVLRGVPSFEGRSSLKTWIYRILINRAKTRGQRDSRLLPFTSHTSATLPDEDDTDSMDLLFARAESGGHWLSAPRSWQDLPEERFLSHETRAMIDEAIRMLPETQQRVIRLRDIEGLSSADVCNMLEISETNQRVLLHRARERVRHALAAYLTPEIIEP